MVQVNGSVSSKAIHTADNRSANTWVLVNLVDEVEVGGAAVDKRVCDKLLVCSTHRVRTRVCAQRRQLGCQLSRQLLVVHAGRHIHRGCRQPPSSSNLQSGALLFAA